MLDQFNRKACAACQEMHDSVLKHRELIAQSHELIAKVDKILERDWMVLAPIGSLSQPPK